MEKIHKKNKSTSDLSTIARQDDDTSWIENVKFKVAMSAISAVARQDDDNTWIDNVKFKVAKFFIPAVGDILNDITATYEKAQSNKTIIRRLVDKVEAAEYIICALKGVEFEDRCTSRDYFNLQRLVQVLRKMKDFAEEITQYNKVQKFVSSKTIEERCEELFKEYDECINLLNLTLTANVAAKDKIKTAMMEDDLNEIRLFLEKIKELQDSFNENLSFFGQKIQNLEKKRDEVQNLEKKQEKQQTSLQKLVATSQKSKQIGEILDKKEQEIVNLEILIEYKQNEINTKDKEIQGPFLSEEEKNKLEKQIKDLKNQIINLQIQLTKKEKEIEVLKQENNVLIE